MAYKIIGTLFEDGYPTSAIASYVETEEEDLTTAYDMIQFIEERTWDTVVGQKVLAEEPDGDKSQFMDNHYLVFSVLAG